MITVLSTTYQKIKFIKICIYILFVFSNINQVQASDIPTNTTLQWSDGFESYSAGSFPSSNWSISGNTDIQVTNTVRETGNNSLDLYGIIGGNWAALAHRQYNPSNELLIEVSVNNGSESISGIHNFRGEVQLNTGPSWTTPVVSLLMFGDNGNIYAGPNATSPILSSYLSGTWYDVQMLYQVMNGGTYDVSYWINGTFEGTYANTSISQQNNLAYLGIVSGAGTTYFDNVSVSTVVPIPSAVWLFLTGFSGLLGFKRHKAA